jgi:hypothetical protein
MNGDKVDRGKSGEYWILHHSEGLQRDIPAKKKKLHAKLGNRSDEAIKR